VDFAGDPVVDLVAPDFVAADFVAANFGLAGIELGVACEVWVWDAVG